MSDRRKNIFRNSGLAGVILASALLAVPSVMAQSAGDWTLNIDNTGYNLMPAGGLLPYGIRIDSSANGGTPASSITFTIPATATYEGISGLDNCVGTPDLVTPTSVKCDVPALADGGSLNAIVNLRPMQEGIISLTGTMPHGTTFTRPTTVQKGADLSVLMSVSPTTVQAGSRAGFKAKIHNNGPYPSQSARLVIPVPSGLSSAVTMPAGCSIASNTITCDIAGPIAVDQDIELDFSAQVTTENASTVTVAATVSSTAPRDGVSDNDHSTADITVTPGTDVSVGKLRSPSGLILIGDTVTFTLSPRYVGNVPTSATLTDTVPAEYEIVSVTPTAASGWTCPAPVGQAIDCAYTAAAGTSYPAAITIVTKAKSASAAGGVTNTATIASVDENADAKDNNNGTDGVAHIVAPTVDLVAMKSGPRGGLAVVGQSYDFTLRARNDGNAPFHGPLTITDHLPAGLTLTAANLPAGWSCSPALPLVGGPGADFSCTTNNYTPGAPLGSTQQTPNLVLTADVTAAGKFTNGMTVSYPGYDQPGGDIDLPNNTTGSDVDSSEGPNSADVSVVKTRKGPVVAVDSGSPVSFDIEIRNAGPASSQNVVLDDRLNDIVNGANGGQPQPGDVVVTHTLGNATGLVCSFPNSSAYSADLQCVIDDLPKCTTGVDCPVVTVTMRTGSQGTKTNTANVFSTKTPDPVLTNNSSSVNYDVTSRTDVTVQKSSPVSALGAKAGQELIYVLTAIVPRNGLSDADNVTLVDTLPEGLVFKSADPSSGVCAVKPAAGAITTALNKTLSCNLGTIANGAQQTVTVTVVPTTAIVDDIAVNNVLVSTSTTEPDKSNNSAMLPIKILPPELDLIISKTDGPDPLEINLNTTYTIKVRNSGPSDAFNVVMVDTLPTTGLANPVVTGSVGGSCVLAGTSPTVPGGTVTCTFPHLAANKDADVTLTMKGVARGRHTNNVSVTSDETVGGYEFPQTNNTSYEDTTVRERVDLLVTKVPSVSTVDLRKEFSWTITVLNQAGAGLGIADSVTLNDVLPAGMELTRVPVAPPGTTCTGVVGGRNISCELGDIANGASVEITLYTKITSLSAQAASNSATATTLSFEQTPPNNTGSGSVTTVQGASISGKVYRDFNANDSKDGVDTGIASLTISLEGTALHDGAVITRAIPTDPQGNYSFTELPPGTYNVYYGTISEQHLRDGKALPGLAAGLAIASGVNRINNIVITNAINGTGHDFTRVPVARIGLGKVAGTPTILADGTYTIAYSLTVKNFSLEPVTGVSVTDILDGASQNFGTNSGIALPTEGQYRVESVTSTFGSLNSAFNGATVTSLLTNGTLPAGATGTLTYTVLVNPVIPRVVPALVHTNQASVSAIGQHSAQTPNDLSHNNANPDPDGNGIPNEPNNNTPTTVTPAASPAVDLVKTATPRRVAGIPAVGDIIDYAFQVTNTGKTPLLNVTVTDPLIGLAWVNNTPIARLNPGVVDTTSYTATYTLTQADLDRGTVPNTATVTGQWGVSGVTPQNVTDTSNATVPALSRPGLTIVKTLESAAGIGNPRTAVGDIARYRFVVTNTGNTTLNNVTVTDALSGVAADPAGSFTIGTMAPGATTTVYANYPVKQGDIDAGSVSNSATAGAVHGPGNTPITTPPSSVNVPLYREPGLTVTKSLTSTIPAVPRQGTPITWTVKATNTGNVTLTNLVVTDPYPGAVVTPASHASLAPGASYSFTVNAPLDQASINSGSLDNTATINFSDPVGPQPPRTASYHEPLPAHSPAIALKKTGNVSGLSNPPKVGDTIAYTIVIRNTGNVALNSITLVDLLAGVVLDSADVIAMQAAVLKPQNAAGTVPASENEITVRATYALKVADIDRGSVINTAVTTGKSVPVPGTTVTDRGGTTFETDDPTDTPLAQSPSIGLVKSITSAALSTPPKVGDVITYGFVVTNTGNVTLNNIALTDAVAGVVISNPTNWTGPLVPAATNSTAFTATYALTQADINAGTFVNTARVEGTGPGVGGVPTTVNATSTATQPVARTSSLTVVKSATPTLTTPPAAGDVIDYTFVVTNTGNTTLTNVVLTDPLVDLVMNSPTTIATLLPGAANAVTIDATYVVKQSDIHTGKVTNQASVSFNDPVGPQPIVPSNRVDVPLTQSPSIAIVKSSASGLSDPAVVGQVITYSFTVTNTGNMDLTGVVINDPLARLTPGSFTVPGTLAPGQTSSVFTATYAIDANDIAAGEVRNQATATGTYDDGSGPKTVTDLSGPTITTDAPEIVPVLPEAPSMTIVKTGSFARTGAYVYVGDVIDYQFVVTNTGNVPLSNVLPRELGITFGGRPATGVVEPILPGPQTIAVGGNATYTTRYVLTQDDINNAAGLANGVANRADATGDYNGTPVTATPDDAILSIPTQEPADITIVKRALVSSIRRGETAGFVISVTNNSLADVGLVTITDRLPNGFTFVEGSATVNAVAVTPVVVGPVVTFPPTRLGPKGSIEIRLVLRALPTTPPGTYRNIAEGTDAIGTPLAPPAHADIRIDAEAVFDCSDVIGTVYDDRNRNGYQDQDEPGIPGVRLSTVRGTLITTDAYGRYSVPCAALPNGNTGSNFVLKIDERTLPTGFSLTTENPGMVRLTPGKMVELNFGASIGREIRLKLDASAFVGGSTAPVAALDGGLDQVITLLEPERSTLFISYQPSTDGALARQRVDHIVTLIRERWDRAGEPYRLVINTAIGEN